MTGIRPPPTDGEAQRWATTANLRELRTLPAGTRVRTAGRLLHRDPDCVLLRDGHGNQQVRLPAASARPPMTRLEPGQPRPGVWLHVTGTWDGHTLQAERWAVASPGRPDGPGPRSDWHRLNTANARGQTGLDRLRCRAALLREIRRFFESRDFLEVETPAAVPSPGLDLHLDAFPLEGTREARWLATSPEYQMKRLLSAGAERIFQLCHCFRAEERGPLHEPEFTMLEWYRSLAGSESVMEDTEALIVSLARVLHGQPVLQTAKGEVNLTPPWPRISVTEAFEHHAGIQLAGLDDETFFRLLVEKVEPALGRTQPVFLVDYPARLASLARLRPDAPEFADRFELYVQGIELCNGFGELTDPDEQERRLQSDRSAREALGKPAYPVDRRFLDALRDGVPASGGNALGVDRLIMLLLGTPSIQDVMAFPDGQL